MVTTVVFYLTLLLFSSGTAKECVCGVENVAPRIINGHESIPGQFPWIVYILNRELMMSCTGTILSDRHIITSAHCLSPRQDPGKLFVFTNQGCGKADLFAGKQLKVKAAFRHVDYITRTGGSDIAILILQRSLKFNSTFMPICLSMNRTIEHENSLIVAGWGNSNQGYTIIDNDCLNEADIDPVPNYICRLHYGTYLDTEKIMCAGGVSNICHGDSGGPLMGRKDGLVYLIGITSFGRTDCGVATEQPSGFERVSAHIEWLIARSLSGHLCFPQRMNRL